MNRTMINRVSRIEADRSFGDDGPRVFYSDEEADRAYAEGHRGAVYIFPPVASSTEEWLAECTPKDRR